MDERLQFVARRLAGEPMTELCREFGISRKTGYKIVFAGQSASKKFMTVSGWSALWILIWDTSISTLECSNRSKIRSARSCYLCSRYVLLPMCPGWTH
jgi:hypothetical protein